MAKRPNADEQLKLRKKAAEELHRLTEIYDDKESKEVIEDFKSRYAVCEITLKILLEDYLVRTNQIQKGDRIKVNLSQVKTALKRYGYTFNDDYIDNLFGSKNNKGQKSAKKIRDNLNHTMKKSYIDELMERKDELYDYMNSFFILINNGQ